MTKYIFSLAWLIQLGIGIAFFSLSCWVEIQVLTKLLDDELLAIVMAVALEVGKALAIFWNRFMQMGSLS